MPESATTTTQAPPGTQTQEQQTQTESQQETPAQAEESRRAPGPHHVGFVAPGPKDDTHYNTFVVRPQYRIRLHCYPEDLDLIFPETIETETGKKARLQALNYYHHPLDYTEPAPSPADPNWRACILECWDYYKKNEGNQPAGTTDWEDRTPLTDREAADKLRLQLGTKIVDADIRQHDQVRRLYLWGGHAMFNEHTFNEYFLKAVEGGETNRHRMEKKTLKANDGLNRIPLIATVEKRQGSGDKWEPAEAVWVYFQLVTPELKEDGQPAAARLAQETQDAVTAAAGPRAQVAAAQAAEAKPHNQVRTARANFNADPTPANRQAWQDAFNVYTNRRTQTDARARAAAPTSQAAVQATHKEYMNKVYAQDRQGVADDDPQKENASAARGGKRGNDIAGTDALKNIFYTGDFEGFNKRPADANKQQLFNKSRQTPDDPEKQRLEFDAPRDAGGIIPNSVRAQTNADGETGVIFMPSFCAGDRYKIRAIVGPETIDTDGTEFDNNPKITYVDETCTFEIWKRARVSKMMELRTDPVTAIGTGAGSTIDQAYEAGYLDLIYDRPQMLEITQAMWVAAYNDARAKALNNAQSPSLNQFRNRVDIAKLMPANVASITDNSWVPMISVADYNNGLAAPYRRINDPANSDNQNDWIRVGIDEIRSFMLNAMLAYFSKSGHLPGITKVRCAKSVPHEYEDDVLNAYLGGMSMQQHGCYTFLNDADYHNDVWRKSSGNPTEAIAIHEIGHTWLLRHQFTDNGDNDGWELNPIHTHFFENIQRNASPPPTYTYNTPPDLNKICNMSYHPDIAGDFCGKCCLSLAGWNIPGIPEPA